jgi:hypothetical protein
VVVRTDVSGALDRVIEALARESMGLALWGALRG